jgi:lipid-binding SYLF domain-containing protein
MIYLKTPVILLAILVSSFVVTSPARAATAEELRRDALVAIHQLYAKNPKAVEVANECSAMLVFPTVVKAGFIFGAQGGDGVLFSNGAPDSYYHTSAVSYGLQAGAQKYSYVMFFMNHRALNYIHKSGGWEIGTGPSIVIVDTGMAKSLSVKTLNKDVYAFIFSQKGLMGGLGLQGSKITQFTPDE